MSADIIAFLRARFDEAESAAKAAIDEWGADDRAHWERYELSGKLTDTGWWPPPEGLDRHWQLTSPWWVLSDVEVKRRIVGLLWSDEDQRFMHDAGDVVVVRLLALPYADHPDYNREWRLQTASHS